MFGIGWDEVEAESIAKQVVLSRDAVETKMLGCVNAGSAGGLNSSVHTAVRSPDCDVLCGSGAPLEAPVRTFMESRFGYNFGDVRIHSDMYAAASARSLNARAYTYGNHIIFGPQQYAPNTVSGRLLLAHELAHVVQQESRGIKRIQCFEAAVHECIEHYALIRGSKILSSHEAHAVYFGNWMRDFNQVFVPLVLSIGNSSGLLSPFLHYDNLFLLMNRLAYTKFRRYLTHEQFGYYIPAEHMDSPAGLVKKHDLLDGQPSLSSDSLNPRSASIYKKRSQHLDTPQQEVRPDSIVSDKQPRILCNIFACDQTAVIGFLRRTNIHVEKRLELAVMRGRNPDGMMHFGAALHAVEDLFGHSNWVEIALDKVLKDDPALLPELEGADREVFAFSPHVEVAGTKKLLLTSGSFSSADTVISLHSELINILAKGSAEFTTNEEKEAERRFVRSMLKHLSGRFKKDMEFRKAVQDTEFYRTVDGLAKHPVLSPFLPEKTTDWVFENLEWLYIKLLPSLPDRLRKITHEAIEVIKTILMREFSTQLLAFGVRNSVADTSLIKSLRDNLAKTRTKKLSDEEMAALKRQAPWIGKAFGELKNKQIEEAEDRVLNLQNTPTKIVAGPSHSQLSKDHINSVFFGPSFFIAAVAVERLKDKLVGAWEEQSHSSSKPYRFSDEQTAKPLEEAAREASIRAEGIMHAGGDIPEKFYDLVAFRKQSADEVRATAERLDRISSAPMRAADRMDAMRSHLEGLLQGQLGPDMPLGVAGNLIEYSAEALAEVARLSRQAGKKLEEKTVLKDTAKELRICAGIIQTAVSHKQREKANELLKECRRNTFKRLMSIPQTDFELYSSILLAIDLHIATTAVTFTSEQRRVVEGKQGLPEVTKSLKASKITLPSVQHKRKAIRELMEEVRIILSHPYENDWWEEPVKDFIKRNPEQMIWEIRARNEGYPVFRMPTKAEYEALQKRRQMQTGA